MTIHRGAALLLAAGLVAATVDAQTATAPDVLISPRFVTAPLSVQENVKAGSYVVVPLGRLGTGERASVQVQSENKVYNDITAVVMAEDSVPRYLANQPVTAFGFNKRHTPFTITLTAPQDANYVVVFDNRYSLAVTKLVRATAQVEHVLSDDATGRLRTAFAGLLTQIQRQYQVPAFAIQVEPCGQVNAFSAARTGNITLCTEMISKTSADMGALAGITYHELGHTFLKLWGLPGFDNEDTADEFAVQALLRERNGRQLAQQFAAFFEGGNPWLEARTIIERGDRHTLGIQRARNIRAAADKSTELTARWNRLVYPKLTDQYLQRIAENAGEFDSSALAKEVLTQRGSLPKVTDASLSK